MNKKQKIINYTALAMKDVCWMILKDNYGIYPIYDYSENRLFYDCRKKLKKVIKINNLSLKDVKELRGTYYRDFTYPMCEKISEKFYKKTII